jgi:ribose 5-phosphate isomerase B
MQKEIIYLGADHAGFALKEQLKSSLSQKGYLVRDLGAIVYNKDDDYPDYAAKVASFVQKHAHSKGILICGSAQGVCIVANKFKNIRAVAVSNPQEAKLSRWHNDANILCLSGGGMLKKIGGIGLSKNKAEKIAVTFIRAKFSNKQRHKRRIQKIARLER